MTLGLWLARWFGWVPTLLVSLAWQVLGTVQGESALWWAQPWTWHVRPVLPLLGVHANGVTLEPGSPVWEYPWWPGLAGSLGVTVVFFLLGGRDAPRLALRRTPARQAAARRPRGRLPLTRKPRRLLLGLAVTLRRTTIGWLTLLVVILLPVVGKTWGGDNLRGVVGYLVLPVGSCLLAVLVWQAQAGAWRSVATRASVPALGGRLLALCALVMGGLAGYAAMIAGLVGLGAGESLTFGVVCLITGSAGVALSFWLTTRFGPGAAVGVMLTGLVTGLLFGGFFAETPLWLLGPGAWAYSATSPDRAILACLLSLAAFAACSRLWFSATRRHLAEG